LAPILLTPPALLNVRSRCLLTQTRPDVRQRQMGSEKFGSLQRLHAVYCDGHLEAAQEDWMDIDANFDIGMDAEH